ncbi:MAG: hypothetical protein HY084_14335 [Gemmatimonadetes bacterium]|nr:hypothetical protein [Gemmatimonadota bacterium]
MGTLIRSFALVLALSACARKPDDPRLEFANIGFMLHLPPAMQQALDAYAPGFRSVKINSFRSDVSQFAAEAAGGMQPLFATVADFDGDGTLDAIVEGTAPGDSALRVIAIMNGAAPKALDVERIPLYDADAVGVYLSRPTGSPAGSFELVDYPDSTTTYRYTGGRFVGTKKGN